MAFVASQNFREVDRLLAKPSLPAAEQIHAIGHDAARAFLRYQVSEQNRSYFESWEVFQIALGLVLFMALLFGSTEGKFTMLPVLLMLVIVGVQRFYLTPEITGYGRLLDFAPRSQPSAEQTKFWVLHSGYVAAEVLKWIIGLLLAGKLILHSRRRSRHARSQVDVVDKAYHGHVNG